jgi:class I fructose-bisphosphate aldolase
MTHVKDRETEPDTAAEPHKRTGGTVDVTSDSGRSIRLGRVLDGRDGRSVVATVAHGLLRGALPGEEPPAAMGRYLEALGTAGIDAIVMSPGVLRSNAQHLAGRGSPGIIICLDWTNAFRDRESSLGFVEGRSAAIGTVEDALRMGADAVLTYLFLGAGDPSVEAEGVRQNALISRACDELGVVRIIEAMIRGARLPSDETTRADYVALACRTAFEIGCDLIKTEWTGSTESFRAVVGASPLPILVAGGPRTGRPIEALRLAQDAIEAGAAGVVFGRNIVQIEDSVGMVTALRRVVHGSGSADEAASEAGLG